MSKNRIRHASTHARKLQEYADRHGWTISVNNANHLVLEKAGRQSVHSSLTPSCRFATTKAITDLKRSERAANDNTPEGK